MKVGAAFLLKTKVGVDRFATIGGFKVDEILNARISASGIFTGDLARRSLTITMLNGEAEEFELSFEDGTRLRGELLVDMVKPGEFVHGESQFEIVLLITPGSLREV